MLFRIQGEKWMCSQADPLDDQTNRWKQPTYTKYLLLAKGYWYMNSLFFCQSIYWNENNFYLLSIIVQYDYQPNDQLQKTAS